MQPTKQQQPQIQMYKSPDYRENYANSVTVRVGLSDLLITFGIAKQDGDSEQVTIENIQSIFISPQQAKAFLRVLSQNVSQYEEVFGTIVLEPQQQQPAEQPPVN